MTFWTLFFFYINLLWHYIMVYSSRYAVENTNVLSAVESPVKIWQMTRDQNNMIHYACCVWRDICHKIHSVSQAMTWIGLRVTCCDVTFTQQLRKLLIFCQHVKKKTLLLWLLYMVSLYSRTFKCEMSSGCWQIIPKHYNHFFNFLYDINFWQLIQKKRILLEKQHHTSSYSSINYISCMYNTTYL